MANYKILANAVYGMRPLPYAEGQVIDGSLFNEKHIPELIANKAIVEYTDAMAKKEADAASGETPVAKEVETK